MDTENLVHAIWIGPFDARITLASGQQVDAVSGETICLVGYDEARDSGHWQPCDENGTHISLEDAAVVTDDAPPEKPLDKLTVPELEALCEERGIEIPAGALKADIIDLLTED